jgi:hypothetical protein
MSFIGVQFLVQILLSWVLLLFHSTVTSTARVMPVHLFKFAIDAMVDDSFSLYECHDKSLNYNYNTRMACQVIRIQLAKPTDRIYIRWPLPIFKAIQQCVVGQEHLYAVYNTIT